MIISLLTLGFRAFVMLTNDLRRGSLLAQTSFAVGRERGLIHLGRERPMGCVRVEVRMSVWVDGHVGGLQFETWLEKLFV
jgi:hypothetical protein